MRLRFRHNTKRASRSLPPHSTAVRHHAIGELRRSASPGGAGDLKAPQGAQGAAESDTRNCDGPEATQPMARLEYRQRLAYLSRIAGVFPNRRRHAVRAKSCFACSLRWGGTGRACGLQMRGCKSANPAPGHPGPVGLREPCVCVAWKGRGNA